MEGAAAEVVVVGADGSETSFTFDALVHSEDGESMHADPHSGRPPNLVKRVPAERALRHSWLDAAGDFMSTRVQYVNNDILTDCVLTKDWQVLECIPHSLCLAWAQAASGEQMLIFSLLRALSPSLARPCACLPSSPAPPGRTPCHASASTSASLPRECQCL